MPEFAYKAINQTGQPVKGTMDVSSNEKVIEFLVSHGYTPTDIKESTRKKKAASESLLSRFLNPVRIYELILFTKQLSTMIRAGVSIVRTFEILGDQTENKKLKAIINEMKLDIEAGTSLHETFAKHPGTFSQLYISMIESGETAGRLPEVLDRLIYLLEHEHKVRRDIKSALTYPVIVIVFLFIAFIVLLTWVVPKFTTIYLRFNIDLPIPTQICLFLYGILKNYWPLMLGGLLAIIIFLAYYVRTEQGKYLKDFVLLKIPYIGGLFLKAAMSRFSSIFAILQLSGVSILDIIAILKNTMANAVISREFTTIEEKLREGRGISEPLGASAYFPPMVVNMAAIGEESGNLDEMMNSISIHYDSEVEYAINKLTTALGPLLIVTLTMVVGFFAAAIYLPMWDLTKIVSQH